MMRGRLAVVSWLSGLFVLLALADTAAAQSTPCTVTILNRTTYVAADGSWRIDDLPATRIPTQARYVCTDETGTYRARSRPFVIIEDRDNGVDGSVVMGLLDPVPTSVELEAPEDTLRALEDRLQISAEAVYFSGERVDVTDDEGTSWATSNAGIARVDDVGVVTPIATGRAIISASNSGARELYEVFVRLSGDSDGDGLADDLEVANGLDPTDPADAFEDLDEDGLSNADELLLHGTDIREADTDDDGIDDGEEVVEGEDGFVTSPILSDTDGDAVNDGLEVQTGSDPTDELSFDLDTVLDSFEVVPPSFSITTNVVDAQETSVQLEVAGTLIDDSPIDLTARATYLSSDVGVCTPGELVGEFVAGGTGDCTITVEVGGLSFEVGGSVRSFAPVGRGVVAMPGSPRDLVLIDDFAWAAVGDAGIAVVDVGDAEAPEIVDTFPGLGIAVEVVIEGTRAFVATSGPTLAILDASDPASPAGDDLVQTTGATLGVAISEGAPGLVFVANGAAGLQIVDVSGAEPQLGPLVPLAGEALGVAVDAAATRAVVVLGEAGVQVVDLEAAGGPVAGAVIDTGHANTVGFVAGVALIGDQESGLISLDVSEPDAPLELDRLASGQAGLLQDLHVRDALAFGADVLFTNGVPIFDVRAPDMLAFRSFLDLSDLGEPGGRGVTADESYVYMVTAPTLVGGLPGQLYIGQYRQIQDDLGVAPEVSILEPSISATIFVNEVFQVRVDARDDVAVFDVDLLVGGELYATDDAPPYRFQLQAPDMPGELVLEARAHDFAGLVTTTPELRLPVVEDTGTTVIGRVVDEDGEPLIGAVVQCVGTSNGTVTDINGEFSLEGVPVAQGAISCRVSYTGFSGAVTDVEPMAGVTDVGTIVLTPAVALYPSLKEGVPLGNPKDSVAGDWNRDGAPDLAVAFNNGGGDSGVAILRGDALGRLRLEGRILTERDPFAIASADLNEDMVPDLVVTNGGFQVTNVTNDVSVVLGDGAGGFGEEQVYATSTRPGPVVIADIDGDGSLDIVTGDQGTPGFGNTDGLTYLRGDGNGAFEPPVTTTIEGFDYEPTGMAVGKFDADEWLDIVTANLQASNVSVWLGNGDGSFGAQQDYPAGPFPIRVAVGLVDADDTLDLVVANRGSSAPVTDGEVNVLLGNGDGSFESPRSFAAPTFVSDLELVDYDSDGLLDVVVGLGSGENGAPAFAVYPGLGTGDLGAPFSYPYGNGAHELTAADFDLDGDPDLAVVSGAIGASAVSVLPTVVMAPGDATFAAETRVPMVAGVSSPYVFDANGDDRLDLVNRSVSATIRLRLADESGGFGEDVEVLDPAGILPRSSEAVVVEDLDGDQVSDLLVLRGDGNVEVAMGVGDGAFATPTLVSRSRGVGGLALVHLDDDGLIDLVAGGGAFQLQIPEAPGTFDFDFTNRFFVVGGKSVDVGDLDGNGFLDAVFAGQGNTMQVVLGGESLSYTHDAATMTHDTPLPSLSVRLGDVNGDQLLDAVVLSGDGSTGTALSTFIGDGDGGFAAPIEAGLPRGASANLVLQDLDGDAIPDAAFSNQREDEVIVMLGLGDGTFADAQRFAVGAFPNGVRAADMNGDGRLDLIVGGERYGTISILEQRSE